MAMYQPACTTREVQALFNLARFDLNKDCCWKNYLQRDSDYFSHSICSFINCISIGFRSGFSRREISSVYLWCW